MIGHTHTMIGKVKGLFTQLLDVIKYNGDNPIGMIDSVSGNDTEFTNSPCLDGDGVVYLSGDILTSDTITAWSGSAIPICNIDGRLDFINGQQYYGVTITRGGSTHAFLSFSECTSDTDTSNLIIFDANDGTDNHFDVVGGSAVILGTQDVFHWGEHGYSSNIEVVEERFPTEDSLPRLDDSGVWRNFVQYSSDVITYTDFNGDRVMRVDTASDFGSYFSTSTGFVESFNCYMEVFIPTDSTISEINIIRWVTEQKIEIPGFSLETTLKGEWVTLGGRDIRTGVYNNMHIQTVGDDGGASNYYYIRSISVLKDSQQTPASAALDGTDALGNPLTVTQDGTQFIKNADTKMKNADVQKLKDKDIHNVWYDGIGTPKEVTFDELEAAITTYPNVYGGDVVSGESIKNISLK